ncbi:MAG: ATP-binding cassette domain-containing protein [Clostridia bacterium]|nr:ATP-binding cassette domain-containing protein [Clostridia bacterium]
MLQIRDLTLTLERDARVLVKDFSFTLAAGDRYVIIGEEGNGKSTLLKWIYDPQLTSAYADAEGLRVLTAGEKLAYLPQQLAMEKRGLSVYAYLSEEPAFTAATPGEIARLETELGLPAGFLYETETMGDLSGGERVKTELARILISRPSLLLLDEPSNDLDLEALEWLEKMIAKTKAGVLFVSHDETLIERAANGVIHIEQLAHKREPRHTVARVPYATYAAERAKRFQTQQHDARMERRQDRIAQEKFQRIQQSVEHAQNTISRKDPAGGRLLKKKMHAVKSLERRYERERGEMTDYPHEESEINIFFDERPALPASREILALQVPELYAGEEEGKEKGAGRLLSREIRLSVRGPEKICLIGKNGCGKTTLMRKIREEAEKRARQKRLRYAYMPQHYEDVLDPEMDPIRFLTHSGSKEENALICDRLASLRFTREDMERPIRLLSGGQQAKLLLLSLVLSEADLLLLDEPTRNFSPLSGPVVRRILASFPGAIVSVSHDRKYMTEVCDTVYRMDEKGLHVVQF